MRVVQIHMVVKYGGKAQLAGRYRGILSENSINLRMGMDIPNPEEIILFIFCMYLGFGHGALTISDFLNQFLLLYDFGGIYCISQ